MEDEAVSRLRKCGLIEGRLAKLRITTNVADSQLDPFSGIKLKRSHRVLIDFLVKYPGASRAKINERMMPEMEGTNDKRQKNSKITNILTYLRKKGLIVNTGTDSDSHWNLCKRGVENQ